MGQLNGTAVIPKRLLDLFEQLERMAPGLVHLVDEGHDGDIAFAADGE